MDHYTAYGQAAKVLTNPILISGRNVFQADQQPHVVNDVVRKLRIERSNRLLEIGCGVGVLLTPLSRLIVEAVGIDHPLCIAKYRELGVPPNVRLIAGRWPEATAPGSFDRILAYSVLHYLPDAEAARTFVDECLAVLRPDGGLLLGDIPNEDALHRFQGSDFGREVHAEYLKRKAACLDEESLKQQEIFSHVKTQAQFLTDDFILGLLTEMRKRGFESYVMPQPSNLPFSYTREDVLIWKRK